jgi:hypothetical protein
MLPALRSAFFHDGFGTWLGWRIGWGGRICRRSWGFRR